MKEMTNKRRIFSNTILLYFRMLITMLVSLYTSRVVLAVLGVSDFGLYSVVAGFVILLGFLNRSMTSSTQRFLNFEKGRRDLERLKSVFSTSLTIHFIISAFVLLLAETVGLWFLNYRMNIPADRMYAANWVFQFSVFSLLITILSVPYSAVIIANERMSAFALISIVEVFFKLLMAFLLYVIRFDSLILYSFLMLLATLTVRVIYGEYSKRNFRECRVGPKIERGLFKEMMGFSVWSVTSNLSIALRTQGGSVLLNIFFGTIVNTAQGIALQVNAALSSLVLNFTQALNPQIVKNYAAGDLISMRDLIFLGSRVAFFLIFAASLPILFETEFILKLWLSSVPEYAVIFVKLILVQAIVESFASISSTAQGATGNVREYHLVLSLLGLFNLPASYFILKAGGNAYSIFYVSIGISVLIGVARLLFLSRSIDLSLIEFGRKVVFKCLAVILFSILLPAYLKTNLNTTSFNSSLNCIVCVLSVCFSAFFFGFERRERLSIVTIFASKLK